MAHTDNIAAEREHIDVVDFTAVVGSIDALYHTAINPLVLVGDNAHTHAGAAEYNTAVGFSALNLLGNAVANDRIKNRRVLFSTQITHLVTKFDKMLFYCIFQFNSARIGGKCNFHIQILFFRNLVLRHNNIVFLYCWCCSGSGNQQEV